MSVKVLRALSASIGGIAGFLWGQLDGLLLALIALICLDYITGIIVGAARHKLNSAASFKGIAKKALILIMVAVAHIMDSQVLGGDASVCRSAVCGLYIANEGLSILENAGKLGLPMPKKLRNMLAQLHDNSEEEKRDVHTETHKTRKRK